MIDETMDHLTALIHSSNSEATIEAALKSVAWAGQVLVVDMASSDRTVEIAEQFGARVIKIPQQPWGDHLRNEHLAAVESEWSLVLDSDESLDPDAGEVVRGLIAERGARYDAFAVPRENLIAGQVMRSSGWWPDRQIRLFRSGSVSYSRKLHRQPEVVGGESRVCSLDEDDGLVIRHDSYPDLASLIERQVRYAVTDHYDDDPESFDVGAYTQQAYEALSIRLDVQKDGDLSRALATVMAWDAVVRALVHWDSLEPRPPLEGFLALPITTTSSPELQERYDELLAAYENVLQSKSWRITAPLRRLRGNS